MSLIPVANKEIGIKTKALEKDLHVINQLIEEAATINDQIIEELVKENRIAYQYCSNQGLIEEKSNINGSINNIAGIINDAGNVLGMMPHPERAIGTKLGGNDGIDFFKNFFEKLG
jgi:phosphoribosylformylglycinamidine (FGAM) synthase-like amidotransferase family enzyme